LVVVARTIFAVLDSAGVAGGGDSCGGDCRWWFMPLPLVMLPLGHVVGDGRCGWW